MRKMSVLRFVCVCLLLYFANSLRNCRDDSLSQRFLSHWLYHVPSHDKVITLTLFLLLSVCSNHKILPNFTSWPNFGIQVGHRKVKS